MEGRGLKIQVVYMVAMVFWLLLILGLDLYLTTWIGWLFILLPFIVFIFGLVNSDDLCENVEGAVFEADFLSIGLLVVLPLLTWVTKDYGGDRQYFLSLIVVAIILAMMSMLDIWVPFKSLYIVKHAKSVLQTCALALLMFAFYTYYVHSGSSRKNNDTFSYESVLWSQ